MPNDELRHDDEVNWRETCSSREMCNVSGDSLSEGRDTSASRTFLYVTMAPLRITLHTAARGEWRVAVLLWRGWPLLSRFIL